MSMGFIKNGKYVQVAGNPPPSGELVTGASTIRKGTVTGTTSTGYFQGTVTFDSPMPDNDYEVTISFSSITATHHTWMLVNVFEKTATGFKYSVRDTAYNDSEASTAQAIACTFDYTAVKLYTVEGVEELEAKVNDFGKKVLWTGSVTKGANIGTLNLAGYDMVIAYLNGRPAFLQGAPSNGDRCKFVAHWTGRDKVDDPIYVQEYVCDVAADGTVMLCAWLNIAELGNVVSTVGEANVNLTQIIGYKFPTLA